MTADSLSLFLRLADQAGDWSGTPLIDITPAQRGNLTDLKRLELLDTFLDRGDAFARFTPVGVALAKDHGIDLAWTLTDPLIWGQA